MPRKLIFILNKVFFCGVKLKCGMLLDCHLISLRVESAPNRSEIKFRGQYMPAKRYFNWKYTLFFTAVPLVGIVGTILLLCLSAILWQTWALAGVFLVLGGFSITAGYHRLFAHRTYRAAWPVRLLFVLFGASSFQGSVLEWSTDHRNHHRYTDTTADPYNIQQGFWYAHIGWIFGLDPKKRDFSNVGDLQKSALLVYQDRHFVLLSLVMGVCFTNSDCCTLGTSFGRIYCCRLVTFDHFASWYILY